MRFCPSGHELLVLGLSRDEDAGDIELFGDGPSVAQWKLLIKSMPDLCVCDTPMFFST